MWRSRAQALGLRTGELAPREEEPLRPDEQVLACEHELEPGGVGLEGAEGEVKAALLAAADAVLGRGAGAVELLEAGDARALLVGEEDLEAVAVVIGEGELGAGVGALAAADGARPLRPGRKIESKLGHPCPFSLLSVLGEGRLPG